MAFKIVLDVIQNRKLGGNAKLLAIILANYAKKENGMAWPSQQTLSEMTGLNLRTVQRTLPILEEKGILKKKRGNGRTHKSRYQFIAMTNGDILTSFPGEKGDNLSKKGDKLTPDPIRTKRKSSFVSQNLPAKNPKVKPRRGNGVVL